MSDANPPVMTTPPQKSNTTLIIAIVLAVVAVPVVLVCIGILVGLLLPAVQASREAARRMQCSNNLKQIALAMHNYNDTFGSFPPAYTTDSEGRRLHSWRTLLLPFLGEQAVYNTIDLSKPWDDPVNQQAASTAIPFYHCPSSPADASNQTSYQVVVDPSSVFPGETPVEFDDIVDGSANTLLVVEVPDSLAVPWMSPDDCDMQEYLSYAQARHMGGFQVAFADGSVQFISQTTDPGIRDAMVTRNGGEDMSAR